MDSIKKKVFFHVGTVKTGSTYIQKFLFDNKLLLQEMDVDYLILSPLRLDLPRYANADFILEKGFDKNVVIRAIELSPCKNILISEEGLLARSDVLTHSAFDDFEKTAIMYVRPPVELIASWAGEMSLPYNFWIGSHPSINGIIPVYKAIPRLQWEYHATVENFLDALDLRPDVRLSVRPYVREEFVNGNIIDDFFSVLGVDIPNSMREAIEKSRATFVNEGRTRKYCDISVLCAQELERYRALAQFGSNLVDYVYDACVSGDDRKILDTLSDAEMQEIYVRLKPTYDRLRSKDDVFEGAAVLPPGFGHNRAPYQPVNECELRTHVADFLFNRCRDRLPQGAAGDDPGGRWCMKN